MIADVLSGTRSWHIECCDVLGGLAQLPDESVNCIVTSPPYFGLRSYGTETWEGGDPECAHRGYGGTGAHANHGGHKHGTAADYYPASSIRGGDPTRCRCGATRTDTTVGLEVTVDEYIDTLRAVFIECRRILRADGTCWLNLGDCYSSAEKGAGGDDSSTLSPSGTRVQRAAHKSADYRAVHLARKQLVGVPWRVAFALQADGWWLRSDVVWSKPNPMPESVTDRPTRAHEFVFLLTRSALYFYDADAVRVPAKYAGPNGRQRSPYAQGFARRTREEELERQDKKRGHSRRHAGFNDRWDDMSRDEQIALGANLRDVWTIATQPYPEAHFATFPTALVEPCVKAGCPAGGLVLDPFAGAGTTGVVALRHGRRFIGFDLSPTYCELARRRIRDDAPLFNGEQP